MNIFDTNNKLDCSKSNPNYNYIVALLWQLCTDSIYLIKTGNLNVAKLVLSKGVGGVFPKEPSNLDSLSSVGIFYGSDSTRFSKIYFDLVDLWKDIQKDGISDVSGDDFILTDETILSILSKTQSEIEGLVS